MNPMARIKEIIIRKDKTLTLTNNEYIENCNDIAGHSAYHATNYMNNKNTNLLKSRSERGISKW
jgi:hypothetical protein